MSIKVTQDLFLKHLDLVFQTLVFSLHFILRSQRSLYIIAHSQLYHELVYFSSLIFIQTWVCISSSCVVFLVQNRHLTELRLEIRSFSLQLFNLVFIISEQPLVLIHFFRLSVCEFLQLLIFLPEILRHPSHLSEKAILELDLF